MTAHSSHSPSGAGQWISCPGSVQLIETLNLPDSSNTSFAEEGTLAHELGEWALKNRRPLSEASDNEEMIAAVQHYVDYVEEFRSIENIQILVEEEINLHAVIPNQFGHADCIVIDEYNATIEVIDYKHGQGVGVLAENNYQLMLYMLGILTSLKLPFTPDKIILTVVQPRVMDGHGPIRRWEVERGVLFDFAKTARRAYDESLRPGARLCAGNVQCRWCDARSICPELQKLALDTAVEEFEPFATRDINMVNLAEVLPYVDLIKKWCDAVLERALETLKHGREVEGYKLVRGRSARRWVNAENAARAVEATLGDDAYTKKLLSPTQFEKADKKAYAQIAEDLVEKPIGKLTIAPDSDKRQPVDPLAEWK